MPQTDPIADAFGIPVTEGAEAQLTKAAEAEASGKKRNAEDLGQSYRPKPVCQYFPQNVIQAHHTAETGPRGSGGGDGTQRTLRGPGRRAADHGQKGKDVAHMGP